LVKFSNTLPQSLWGFALCTTPHGIAQRFIYYWENSDEADATPETDELGNGREDGRGAAIREQGNDRAKNGKFNAGSDFNPSDRDRNWNVTRRSFDFSMRDKDDGAIAIVFGNSPTVQPRMKRRANFRRRHEQP
jgi:hypothetical protein